AVGSGVCECLFDKWWLSRAGLRAARCVDLATRMEKHRRCFISPPGRRSADASSADPPCLAFSAFAGAAARVLRPVVPHFVGAGAGPAGAGAPPYRGRDAAGGGTGPRLAA